MKNVLVVAAHPDDEVLGCGGTIARLSAEGYGVVVAIMGEGSTSRSVTSEESDLQEVEILRTQSSNASEILGVSEVRFFGLPDNRFDTVALLDVVKSIEGLMREFRPEIIYTHHGGDLNVDHQITFRSVLTATRPMMGDSVKRVLCFEVQSSSEWSFGHLAPAFQPEYFVDIHQTLEMKLEAMACYVGEMREYPHPRSREAIRALAVHRGAAAGLRAAEAFQVVRWIETLAVI